MDSFIFTLIAFYGTFGTEVWIELFITTYLFKFIVAVLDTPFLYWAKKIRPNEVNITKE